jgi:alpha-glucosidase
VRSDHRTSTERARRAARESRPTTAARAIEWIASVIRVSNADVAEQAQTSPAQQPPWWKQAVFYQVYPRSFADSDGDGVGDLAGIRSHLVDLAWLGVDALWISPFYRSPMVDFGYDISDYCDVDPCFGTLDEFDRLVADAHSLGIKVIIDWVPNHTSDQHPWFIDAASDTGSEHRSWYVWRDPRPDGAPPNNWVAAFDLSAPAWTLDESSGQWYLHLFESAQPDLNWDEPEVVTAMHHVLRFWLDRGADGFRADVIHCIGKDPDLPDDPQPVAGIPHSALNDVPVTHQRLRDIRSLIDGYPGDRLIVGEVYLLSTAAVATYYGDGDELHLAFNFPPLYARWQPRPWTECIEQTVEALDPREAWPSWVLSNHDNRRHRTRYDRAAAYLGEDPTTTERRSEARARAAAVLLLTLRGTPFLYQGEELGLLDADIPADRKVDPGGRDGCRAPIPWDGTSDHGWPTVGDNGPWLPFPPDAIHRNHGDLRNDTTSILHLYRRLIALRHRVPALSLGDFELLDLPEGLLGYQRTLGGDAWTVVVNFSDRVIGVDDDPRSEADARSDVNGEAPLTGLRVELSSDGSGDGHPFDGRLRTDQAVVLRH